MRQVSLRSVLVAGLLSCSVVAGAHGTSKSYADWTISGRRVEARLAFASHDVLAAVGGLDANRDGRLAAKELAEGAAELGLRVAASATVTAGRQQPELRCLPEAPTVRGMSDPVEEIQVEVVYACPTRVGAVAVATRFLPALEPPHVSVATFAGAGVDATHVFTITEPSLTLRLQLPSLAEEVTAGIEHTLRAYLTLGGALLLLGLALMSVGSGRWPRALGFGLAGAISASASPVTWIAWAQVGWLAWGAYELFTLSEPARAPRQVRRLVWALGAGALAGWGAIGALGEVEPPVRWAGQAALLLVPIAVSALGGLVGPGSSKVWPKFGGISLAIGAVGLLIWRLVAG